MSLLLLLLACDDETGLPGARARARAFLDAHPKGTAMVRVAVDGPAFDAVVGEAWESADLQDFLRICGAPPAAAFDAELTVGPGEFPHPYLEQRTEGEILACVWDRLATFPVDGPSGRDEKVLFVIRWRPEETGDGARVHEQAGDALPRGALTLPPPYYRYGAGVAWRSVTVDEGEVRFRYEPGPVYAGPLPDPETWARRLTCTAAEGDLVRTTLIFDRGELESVDTRPQTACVEEQARANLESLLPLVVGDEQVGDLTHLAVVIDVPVRPW